VLKGSWLSVLRILYSEAVKKQGNQLRGYSSNPENQNGSSAWSSRSSEKWNMPCILKGLVNQLSGWIACRV
jgi:hypothetical protein